MYHSQTMLKLCPLSWRELHSWYMCMGACVSMHMCRCLLGHVCACYKLCEEGKKRESLNVTLLSTVTMLTTCDVSGRIIVAHWACAEQAPSPPRVLRICTRFTRGWACTEPQRVENATLITFFFFLCSVPSSSGCVCYRPYCLLFVVPAPSLHRQPHMTDALPRGSHGSLWYQQ